jgi:hypothetical protein
MSKTSDLAIKMLILVCRIEQSWMDLRWILSSDLALGHLAGFSSEVPWGHTSQTQIFKQGGSYNRKLLQIRTLLRRLIASERSQVLSHLSLW